MAGEHNGRGFDPGSRAILKELRDLRLEMRADRRQADEERRQADEERRQASEERRRADEERRQERLQSDARFEQLLHDFRQDSSRREAATQKAFSDVRAVGLSIVKTLNRHTRILEHHGRLLERIDRKLGARGNGRPGPGNGRG
jgi:hypothetical protein